jgi:hypothetical protein
MVTRETYAAAGKSILKWTIGKEGWRMWIGLIWLRVGTGGGLL